MLKIVTGVIFVLCMLPGLICQDFKFSSLGPFMTSRILRLTPVKITSPEGTPLFAFYMTDSTLKPEIQVYMDSDFSASFEYSVICSNRNVTFVLEVTTETEHSNIKVKGQNKFPLSCNRALERYLYPTTTFPESNDAETIDTASTTTSLPVQKTLVADGAVNVNFRTDIIGYGIINLRLVQTNGSAYSQPLNNTGNKTVVDEVNEPHISYTVTIVRKIRPIDSIFRLVVYCVQIFVATGFGAKLDLKVVKECLVRPISPAIGLGCQFLLMPLIAFTVAKAIPIDVPMVGLGIFVAGCCPGGGASNMYSYLLQGDLSLSITMTALSTILALGMLPLWLYTLGMTFAGDRELHIPFEMVAASLSVLVVPLLFGLFLRHKFPRAADKLEKALKPVIVVMAIVLLSVGIYSNLYIFRLFKPRIILAACLLPYVGYILGGTVAAIFRQPWYRIKTICIETGLQNTSIAYLLLINSFPPPVGDVAAVAPVASAVMTPIPLFIVTIFYLLYNRWKKRHSKSEVIENGGKDKDGADEKLNSEMTEKANNGCVEKEKLTSI